MWQSVIINGELKAVAEGYQMTQFAAAASTARLVNTRIISRRYSGVNADVVSGFAVFAARSPTAAAIASSTIFPASNSETPFTSKGAGFTAVMPIRASATWRFERFIATATPASG